MTAASIIIAIIIYVLSFAGMWMMFRKAGRKGWISIIPVANTVILFLIGWKKDQAVYLADRDRRNRADHVYRSISDWRSWCRRRNRP